MSNIMRKNIYAKQIFMLVVANGLNIVINVGLSLILTHALSSEDFGLYRYILNAYNTISIFAQLGIPHAASIALTRTDDEIESMRIISVTTLIMLIISILGSLLTLLFGAIAISLGLIEISYGMLLALLFSYTIVLQGMHLEMLKGANEIKTLAFETVFPSILFLMFLLIINFATQRLLAVNQVIGLHVIAQSIVHLLVFKQFYTDIKSRFKDTLKLIVFYWKKTGLNVYIGSLFGVASTYVINMLAGIFVGLADFGIYSLALSISTPIQIIPSTMGNVMFKENAKAKKISRGNILLTLVISGLAFIAFIFVLLKLLPLIFPKKYVSAFTLGAFLSFASLLFGLGDYFNRFIGAKGRGDFLRNASTISGIINVLVSFVGISIFGIQGLVIGRICAGFIYLMSLIVYYYKVISIDYEESDG